MIHCFLYSSQCSCPQGLGRQAATPETLREPATRTDHNHRGVQRPGLWKWSRVSEHRAREGAPTRADKSPPRMKPRGVSVAHGEEPTEQSVTGDPVHGVCDVPGSVLHALDGSSNSRPQPPLEMGTQISTLQMKQKRPREFRQFAGNHS